MSHRILIIDDNHSFIDTLKVGLKDMSLQIDSAFRFFEGEKQIAAHGPRVDQKVLEQLKKLSQESESIPLSLEKHPVSESGWSIILVEQDTETSTKGLQFIESILHSHSGLRPFNFFLMTEKPAMVESYAKKSGVSIFEKPARMQAFRNALQLKLSEIETQEVEVNDLVKAFNLQVNPLSKKKQPARKVLSSKNQKDEFPASKKLNTSRSGVKKTNARGEKKSKE